MKSFYLPTIGLEIHAELKTHTKMFCCCRNNPEEKRPNVNICPICLGHPGTLPTINKKAVEAVLKVGLALNGQVAQVSKFDRKNYFYPDLPKGYQISQYDEPLVTGGYLEIPVDVKNQNNSATSPSQKTLKKIRIRRVHLEEDTGRLIHSDGKGKSLIDFNRAGVPLLELVTEPDISNSEEAMKFAKELRLLFRYLEISDADMEKGQMRVEVNISLQRQKVNALLLGNEHFLDSRDQQQQFFGTKVEIKNLNSFRAVVEAIEYEIVRQANILEKGDKVKQETRGWDDIEKKTFSQRQKEDSHDYRYFPEPDLPKLIFCENLELPSKSLIFRNVEKNCISIENLRLDLPELPFQKRERFLREYGLESEQIEILVNDRYLADFFEHAASELKEQNPKASLMLLSNYLISDVLGLMNKEGIELQSLRITPENLAHLIDLLEQGVLSSRMAKDILVEMFHSGMDPHAIIKDKQIIQVFDKNIIKKCVIEIFEEYQDAVSDYKKGKINALQFLIGKTMAKLKGQGNPKVIVDVINETLEEFSL
jgi:aspartyl-tRNA(Asn)/glutamyl-tRNA(Gln) amidotransferase subunit B